MSGYFGSNEEMDWTSMGYKATKDTTYRRRQNTLKEIHDSNPELYSAKSFYAFLKYLERKGGSNQATKNRRLADYKFLKEYEIIRRYLDTGKLPYVDDGIF